MSTYEERSPGIPVARFACWLGAIVDLGAGIQLLLPPSVSVLAFAGLRQPGAAGVPAVMAAILMFGFSAILLWAQSRVVRRRAVLVITLLVAIALAIANLVFGLSGTVPWGELAGPLVVQAILIGIFATSFSSLVRRRTVFAQRVRLRKME